ncbi:hypothetical protein [Arthrobacter sp. ISL-30]|uniref:hypothetical protein n=1 Tax=Arthrobacter sp. ISL-30 TaxID=2819109 RepID=UPI001BECF751|nr:hypothetical protein [Arthrobacter sp. ISL-30]MBT2514681.1 hypothetical protein [Arthrobacter sp. ISL-30]
MAGLSGFDDLSRQLKDFGDSVVKLDGLTVGIDPDTDSVSAVLDKVRQEIRRKGAYEPTASALRDIAQDMLNDARRRK